MCSLFALFNPSGKPTQKPNCARHFQQCEGAPLVELKPHQALRLDRRKSIANETATVFCDNLVMLAFRARTRAERAVSAQTKLNEEIYLVSFGDETCTVAKRRLAKQAIRSGYFKEIWVWGENDLDQDFTARNRHRLIPGSRGFGYWLWKPQVVLQALQNVPDGSVLLYLDSGCHVVSGCLSGLKRYLGVLGESDVGILSSEIEYLEKYWTKGDLLDFLGVRGDRSITHSGQRQGGVVFYRKSSTSLKFAQDWLDICEGHPDLLDDTASVSPNFPGFKENRHDQSVFSVLSKIYGGATFDGKELMQWDGETTKLPGCFPIETRRDRHPKEPIIKRLMSRLGAPKRFLVKKFIGQNHRDR